MTKIKKNRTIGLDKSQMIEKWGRKLYRVVALAAVAHLGIAEGDLGGWCSEEAIVGERVAWVYSNATFWGGTFWGGTFRGGTFRGGTFEGGTFWGGTFRGGTFRGGTFWGGTFRGGTFWGGTFEGGTFEGGTFTLAVCASRSDGYIFTFNPADDGPRIAAGCRYFTFDEARQHWIATRGGTHLGEESLLLLDHIERMAKLAGVWNDPVEA